MSALALSLVLSPAHAFSPKTQVGVFVLDQDQKHFPLLNKNKEFVVDHKSKKGFELYGPKGLRKYLDQMSIPYFELLEGELSSAADKAIFDKYPTPEEIEKVLKQFAAKYPTFMKLISLGKSVENRDLWMVKLSDNVNVDEVEPEVKYIANMHGNEIVGRELMVLLIKDLAEGYSNGNSRIKRRGNAKWTDLNRDFPDFTTQDNQNSPNGRDPETKAIMKFQAQRNFALSANFHGGTKVVNYPWDTTSSDFPLDKLVKEISVEYAKENQDMRNSRRFKQGVVNGYDWYEVDGGMQDWSYKWHGDLQVTVELSNTKWPDYDDMDDYYKENRESLVRYLERISQGAGFNSQDKNLKGQVEIIKTSGSSQSTLGKFPFGGGEFYKVLENGNYQFKVNAQGKSWSFDTTVDFKNGASEGNYTSLESI